ncbi:hypothetical protein [Pedobacter sp. UBA5917]|jgi:hypothetical protein|uniref:hypothetical protein n=1 Tax=Pedobacter sp. UBA5917 TaxID=1947061 RepID=UPI0025FB9771|nr:hypothetical protein [Pedobacter sp. UBA5917]
MKLKIKAFFIGLEFKIEREVDAPLEILQHRITGELKKLDYSILGRLPNKTIFKDYKYAGRKASPFETWERINSGSFEIIENNHHQSLKFLFSVSIAGPLFAIIVLALMCFLIGYMVFPFALVVVVLNIQRGIDVKNKMQRIFNAVVQSS